MNFEDRFEAWFEELKLKYPLILEPQWEDIEDALEEHGFQTLEFILGPELD